MTFGEKLTRLRKREGLSQEALAEKLGVSRQAVSRWEQSTALPDAAKLLPCAKLFSVNVEWLLDDARNWEDQAQSAEPAQETETRAAHGDRRWYIAGGIVTGAGALGLVVMGIFSAVFPAVVSETPLGVDWVRVYDGLAGFLKAHNVEWLFALWAAAALAGGPDRGPALHRRPGDRPPADGGGGVRTGGAGAPGGDLSSVYGGPHRGRPAPAELKGHGGKKAGGPWASGFFRSSYPIR